MVSEFENITLEEVWKLPTIQFLNDLTYLKLKSEYDADIIRKSTSKFNK